MGVWSGTVRIDIAVINGELAGYELKSDCDTLERLPFQASLYSRVFDRVVLVVGSRHAQKASAHVPDWWGITIATQDGADTVLRQSRRPRKNPAPDPYLIAQLLWKDEALAILHSFGLAKGWRNKRIRAIHQQLSEQLPSTTLRFEVRQALRVRSEWLRNSISGNFDMPINPDLNPSL